MPHGGLGLIWAFPLAQVSLTKCRSDAQRRCRMRPRGRSPRQEAKPAFRCSLKLPSGRRLLPHCVTYSPVTTPQTSLSSLCLFQYNSGPFIRLQIRRRCCFSARFLAAGSRRARRSASTRKLNLPRPGHEPATMAATPTQAILPLQSSSYCSERRAAQRWNYLIDP